MQDDIDYTELEDKSRAELIDSIKAKQMKKADLQTQKLKKLASKKQSLTDKKTKNRRGTRGGGSVKNAKGKGEKKKGDRPEKKRKK